MTADRGRQPARSVGERRRHRDTRHSAAEGSAVSHARRSVAARSGHRYAASHRGCQQKYRVTCLKSGAGGCSGESQLCHRHLPPGIDWPERRRLPRIGVIVWDDRHDRVTERGLETRFRRVVLIESRGVAQGAMMDRAIRECRKLEQRRVKSYLSARLTEAQRRTGGIEYHFVVAPHTKCALKIGGRDPRVLTRLGISKESEERRSMPHAALVVRNIDSASVSCCQLRRLSV